MMIPTKFKEQLPFNLISNAGLFFLNVIIGIWMVPFLIGHLGVEGYGFIPLALSITAFAGLISFSLNGAMSRFLVMALHGNDTGRANRVFNTAFWVLVPLAVWLLPLSGLFSWLTPRVFRVPAYLTAQVQGLFFLMLFSSIVQVFSPVFSASAFAVNRLDLQKFMEMGGIFVRTLLIIVFFVFLRTGLRGVGVAYLAGGAASLALGYFFFRKLTPSLRISRQYFNLETLKELTSMGEWLVVGQIGAMLFWEFNLIVVNVLFGAYEAGQYGAILQGSFLLRSLACLTADVLVPVVLISHARGETQKIVAMTGHAIRFLGLGVAVPIGLLCGFAGPLLTVWLGKDFAPLAPLLWVLTFHLVVNLAVVPLFAIHSAFNRVRIPGAVSFGLGAVSIFLAVVLARHCGWGLYGVAAAAAIKLTAQNGIFTPLYTAHILKLPPMTFLRPLGRGILLAGAGMILGQVLSRLFLICDWAQLFVVAGSVSMACLGGAFLLLGRSREIVFSLLKRNEEPRRWEKGD